jgi:hypothetical protein
MSKVRSRVAAFRASAWLGPSAIAPAKRPCFEENFRSGGPEPSVCPPRGADRKFTSNVLQPAAPCSVKLKTGGPMPFGELAHGVDGLIDDYCRILKLKTKEQILSAFALMGRKKRHANKHSCPCGCERRLGKCKQNAIIRGLRSSLGRRWCRAQYGILFELWKR